MFESFLNGINEHPLTEHIVHELGKRLNKVEPLLDMFISLNLEIISLQDENEDEHLNELQLFQDRFYQITSQAEIIIKKSNEQQSPLPTYVSQSNEPINLVSQRINRVKLPTINLPIFEGNFTQWREFKDKFTSLIGTNDELSNIQKLAYLKSSLKGEPAELLRSLETTDSNYSIAWNRLDKRYNNKRRIVGNHVQAILTIPTMSRGSSQALTNLTATAQNHVDCLRTLDLPVSQWDAILIPILAEKLDSHTRLEWEALMSKECVRADTLPTFDEFIEFLNAKQNTLEAAHTGSKIEIVKNNSVPKQNTRETKSFNITQAVSCVNCKKSHFMYNCEAFLTLDENKRNERVRELKLCLNCMRKGHFVQDCQSQSSCKKCKRRHHTLLHITSNQSKQAEELNKKDNNETINTVANHTAETSDYSEVLLSTAKVLATNTHSKEREIRLLLDSGSQSNFITKDLCEKLHLDLEPITIKVKGINASKSDITHRTTITIKSRCNNFSTTITCLVLPEITTNLPVHSIKLDRVKIPSKIKLADPSFHTSSSIDMLIGANLFYELLCVGQIREKNQPIWQKTKLGWIVSGGVYKTKSTVSSASQSYLTSIDLHKQVERFWNAEELNTKEKRLTVEEQYCEKIYTTTTIRDPTGRFIVKIPMKNNLNQLGDSKNVAKTRLLSIENRLERDQTLRLDYNKFMTEYLNLNHMTKINQIPENSFFLPHHAVIKKESLTTKLRVVFDGSCKLDNGQPVNELQCVGPTIQEELVTIIARFRTHRFVMTADIAKMYRQVLIHQDDRKYQLILWRFQSDKDIETYELNTVTYGTAAAPFLAIRSLIQLAIEHEISYPLESLIIKQDFYVDDLLTGADTIHDLNKIKLNLFNILNTGGFVLRKWTSNTDQLFEADSETLKSIEMTDDIHKTLGISWNPQSDIFSYSINHIKILGSITKRSILATTAQFFDPLGLLAPTIIYAKILLQDIWRIKLGWDESLPYDIQTRWLAFQDKIKYLSKIKIPRYVLIENKINVEIHAFSDASERAYGACMYLRSVDANNKIKTCLLTAKSKVAPLKFVTIPRLELCAALLSTNLVDKFKSKLNVKITRIYYWCDSQIVISWINSTATKFNTYVANRVTEIQSLSSADDWHHVRSKHNPADLISRGILQDELLESQLWWHGPSWLSETFDEPDKSEMLDDILEMKRQTITLLTQTYTDILNIQNYSSLNQLKRIVAYVLRFCVRA